MAKVVKKKPVKKKPAKKKTVKKESLPSTTGATSTTPETTGAIEGFRNRIKERRDVLSSELLANPKNWHEHSAEQAAAVRGLLNEVGIVGALTAWESPDGLQLINGHLRKDLESEQSWPVDILDVDEVEADLLLASLDPLTAMADQDDKLLAELLAELRVEDRDLSKVLSELVDVDDFVPDLDPQQPETEATPGGVEEADDELSTQFGDDEDDDLETIVCPHCHQEFSAPKE